MMTLDEEYTHLHPDYRRYAALDDDARIERIRADRYISYPQAEQALDRLNDLLTYPARGRMPCILLTGEPNIGKSKILEKFLRDHPIVRHEGTRKTAMPVVVMQMPGEPDIGLFYQEMLMGMGAPVSTEQKPNTLRALARQMLSELQVRNLVIDEFEALLSGTARTQRSLLSELRFLHNDMRIEITASGPAEAFTALTTDKHLADRFEVIELVPWKANRVLLDLLVSFESTIPLRAPSQLATPATAKKIVELTAGITGRIFFLLETAAVEAIRNGAEQIDEKTFSDERLVRRYASQAPRARYRQ